jgi:hypothetical protein
MITLYDRLPLSGVRRSKDGYLIADAKVARTGIQVYRGSELGKPDQETVRVYRPESEVFQRDAMASYAHRPVTVDHPSSPVTADSWKELSVGQTGDEIVRDGEFVRVPLSVMDAAAIKQIEDGKREISMGYMADVDWTPGTTPGGEQYDAVQRSMRMNHLAIVSRARGGEELKIGDEIAQEANNVANETTRQVMIDGLTFDAPAQLAQAVEKQNKAFEALQAQIVTDKAAHDKALGEKDAKIEELEKAVVTDAALDRMVADRAEIVTKAKSIVADVKTDGVSNADIRRAVIAKQLGDKYSADWSDEYVGARFDAILDGTQLRADPVRGALVDSQPQNFDDAEARLKRMGIAVRKEA